MTIIPDLETAIVLTIPFLVTYVALHFILFKPLYAYLQERDRAVVTAREEARELSTRIENRTTALDAKLNGAREEVAGLRASARGQAREEEATIIGAARRESDEKVQAAVIEIRSSQQEASIALREASTELSVDIASQVLGRSVQA
ncbi:MAG: ATP synthase F0 subunit B [Deltaproteobacteria bacterium]|nr:ATP synthase F0 subunit B [Deltaproteobacteria bacterium]